MSTEGDTTNFLLGQINYWEEQELRSQRALTYAQRQSAIHIGKLAELGYMVNEDHQLEEVTAKVIQFPYANNRHTSGEPEPAA